LLRCEVIDGDAGNSVKDKGARRFFSVKTEPAYAFDLQVFAYTTRLAPVKPTWLLALARSWKSYKRKKLRLQKLWMRRAQPSSHERR
jgi:hypothetical protein